MSTSTWASYAWPKRSCDRNKLMEVLLATLRGLSLQEQLQKRRIKTVEVRPIIFGGATFVSDDNFNLVLSKFRPESYLVETVGHEIAHTFGFSRKMDLRLGCEEFVNMWPHNNKEVERLTVERFCDDFAGKWLKEGNNRKETEVFVRDVLSRGEIQIF